MPIQEKVFANKSAQCMPKTRIRARWGMHGAWCMVHGARSVMHGSVVVLIYLQRYSKELFHLNKIFELQQVDTILSITFVTVNAASGLAELALRMI